MKKPVNAIKFVWKNNKIWLLTASIVMVFVFTVTMVLTQNLFLRNTLNTVLLGERRVLVSGDPSKYRYFTADENGFVYYDTADSDFGSKAKTFAEANKLNEKIVEEGIVLLKNESEALPLSAGAKISVFGKNSVNLVYGGTGSGGGNSATAATVYGSLEAAGFAVNPTLKTFYESAASGGGRGKSPAMASIPAGLITGETPQSRYTDSVKQSYASYKDAALIVISRVGGEGWDLPRTMKTSFDAGANKVDGAERADDHYLRLDANEKALISEVCAKFDKVVLVVNCSTSFELGFLDDGTYGIDAALWIGNPGNSGINALGRILKGDVNPSGRLVDTYARDFTKDPTWFNFSNNRVSGGNRYTLGTSGQNAYFVEYEEGIYVGYRYYETRGYVEETVYGDGQWYGENVVFPLGYGLSYSTFDWSLKSFTPDGELSKGGEITVEIAVKNTGDKPGQDVVQLYFSAPYYDEGIEKAHVVLGDFAKTPVLAKGGECTVTLSLKVSDMASYDYNDANMNGFYGYEAEAGEYAVYVGRNAHDAWASDNPIELYFDIDAAGGFLYGIDPVTGYGVTNRFDDVSGHFQNADGSVKNLLRRFDFDATMPESPTAAERAVTSAFISSLNYKIEDTAEKPWYVAEEDMPVQGREPAADDLAYMLYDLIVRDEQGNVSVDYDDERWDNLLDRLTTAQMAALIGTGNFNTMQLENINKPKTTDPDGPAGFTNFMGDPTVYDTCFYASECVIAATWNKLLAHDMGVMVGIEGLYGNVKGDGRPYSGWYAPAVNIHRSPFSGRNWEYYSEDSFLSGIMGAHVVQGAKSKGVYTYVKHFALNDQETNRDTNGLITWANEQSMREIYLKTFEIIVKVGKTTGAMSSFNRIGTVWAGGSYELLTEVLRNEWGFRGTVISDYNLYDHMPADQMIRAGGDLNLTQDRKPSADAASLSATQVSALRKATKNILYTVAGSNAMNGMGDGVVWRYAMPVWVILLIVLNLVLLAGFAAWGVFSIRKSLKRQKSVPA
ncbi:MAG: glycoside hydrolase family 3 C-terminal domain-containing protein [Clostridiales bacterium]|jgi:beta-glucosidase|nr:glycoside hydrolase family 3 C-terminal domain-containing protein [Clostridiales bacterium]